MFLMSEKMIGEIKADVKDLYSMLAGDSISATVNWNFKRNRIVFGAPGTGKSFQLNKDKKSLVGENRDQFERVTFHPDYTYSQFVGAYKPVKDNTGSGNKIAYEFVPGPFVRVLVKALNNAKSNELKPFLLLIEEINRADVAAVFGDIFQLLDRDKNGYSEYEISTSEDLRNYLESHLDDGAAAASEIKIPGNMFIWATMNSADQGVLPLDTAFKRRWSFDYVDIDNKEDAISHKNFKVGYGEYEQTINWNCLRKAINDVMSENRINEDKLMGTFFIGKDVIDEECEGADESFVEVFCDKVIMYLFEDAARQKQDKVFDRNDVKYLRYSKICNRFRNEGINIFTKEVIAYYNDYKKVLDSVVGNTENE